MIIALFAVDDYGGMGVNGSLPWPRNREDMQWFKSTTENQIVVMGKKTWNSKDMPVPLPNRINTLITNHPINREDIIQINGDIPTELIAMQDKFPEKNLFIIGGPDILMKSISAIKTVYLTRIPGEYVSDAKIDLVEFLKEFKLTNTTLLKTCKIETYEAISRRA